MIDSKKLLSALQKHVRQLEEDLRARCDGNADVDRPLRIEYEAAKKKGRTAQTYSAWRDEELTQVAVAWVLASVFVRFLEDNELIETPYLAGLGSRLQRAKDEHEMFFRKHPTLTEREYFEKVFTEVGTLPAMKEFFDRKHNPLWQVSPSGDASKELLDFWRKTDPDTGALIHDFTDPDWNTRFLGDLYQDLSEAAQKKFALLQTPDFVEEFILDRTLTPAIQTFGYQVVRMIDPTCGSGHFLIDAFHRLFRLWQNDLPGENPRMLVQKALDGIYGVDLNPYAVAIARFRLLLVALKLCEVKQLKNAPAFAIQLAVGDSLLHGPQPGIAMDRASLLLRIEAANGTYQTEDADALADILSQHYHAVVGNPPYITVKDKALSEGYRAMFSSCYRKYSLSAPFMERFFDLAVKGDGTLQEPAGFVGQISANSFMKREFGKKLIEMLFPRWDLTHVIDTSGAYIPGHGTPTVILFGKNQRPFGPTIRTVQGIRSEASIPSDPAKSVVWQAILQQIDQPGTESEWLSTADSPRINFNKHPWSIGGGGTSELKERIEEACTAQLSDFVLVRRGKPVIGFCAILGEDEAFIRPMNSPALKNLAPEFRRNLVDGDFVRHWNLSSECEVIFPYNEQIEIVSNPELAFIFWPLRTLLGARVDFANETFVEARRVPWEYHQIPAERNRASKLVVFADVATHNHFVLSRGHKLFNRHAPLIMLNNDAEDLHLSLLAALNSSVACFWARLTFFPRGGFAAGKWEERLDWDGTKLAKFPLPEKRPLAFAKALDTLAQELQQHAPAAVLATAANHSRAALEIARTHWETTLQRMIALQEELDWHCYRSYYIIESEDLLAPTGSDGLPVMDGPEAVLPPIRLGERAFEILLAQRMARLEEQSTWFERHGAIANTEPPAHWPEAYLRLYRRRYAAIQKNRDLGLIERPEYKRRWNIEPWDKQFERTACEWLLNRLEGYFFEGSQVYELTDGFNPAGHGFIAATRPHLVTVNQLAEVVNSDTNFLKVAELYHGSAGFSVPKIVRELIEDESVPFLSVHRYTDSGLRKRADWETTWELQRKEDSVEAEIRQRHAGETEDRLKNLIKKAQQERVGNVPVPPKYAGKDFQKSTFWKLRGKLDVPKERWISYPGAERDGDPSPLIAWAGWDHLQQAQALAEYYLDAKSNQGWLEKKLKMLLAGLLDLLPWLKQWHNKLDPDYGMGLGDYFEGFLDEECRALGLTIDAVNVARYSAAPDT
jgi:hypothetical protein